MQELRFEWDPTKDASNQEKHGVSFEEAKSAFLDEFARVIFDPDRSEDEDRFVLLGMSLALNLLVVCHSFDEEEQLVRIISARKADPSERGEYAEHLP